MRNFQHFLAEARKNPDKNPKISAYEALKKYKDNPDIYITFTDLNKVGIKPITDYDTPNGIYTYPLKEIWKQNIDKYKNTWNIPYAARREYIHVLEYNGKTKFLEDMSKNYTKDDYNKDIVKIKDIFFKRFNPKKYKSNLNINTYYIVENGNNKTTFTKMYLKDYQYIIKNFNKLIDYLKKEIHTPYLLSKEELDIEKNFKIEFFGSDNTSELFNVFTDILLQNNRKNKFERLFNVLKKDLAEIKNNVIDAVNYFEGNNNVINDEMFNTFVNNCIKEAKDKNPITLMWYITGKIAQYSNNNQPSQEWNNILRELGYVGMADKSGAGIIHPAEPIQAVFFSTKAINIVETIRNTNPSNEKNYKDKMLDPHTIFGDKDK